MRQRKIRSGSEELLNFFEGGLWFAIKCGQAERPIGNLIAAAIPIVGEAIQNDSGESAAKGGFNLPRQNFRLRFFAFANGVDACFPENERLGIGDHLQAIEIIFERLLVVQINVEAVEIEILRAKIFGRRKISISTA